MHYSFKISHRHDHAQVNMGLQFSFGISIGYLPGTSKVNKYEEIVLEELSTLNNDDDNSPISAMYRTIESATMRTGGGGNNGPIYGEMAQRSMERVVSVLVEHYGMNKCSRFLDVGSGIGKPVFHVGAQTQPVLSMGIEIEEIRYMLSLHCLTKFAVDVALPVGFVCGDICNARTLVSLKQLKYIRLLVTLYFFLLGSIYTYLPIRYGNEPYYTFSHG